MSTGSGGLSASDPQSTLMDILPLVPESSLLKRSASPSFDSVDNHKRMKQDKDHNSCNDLLETPVDVDGDIEFADVLVDDLQCGCCSELVYKPVLVIPCQHFFCGSCCILWIRNGGTNCPACRTAATVAMPFRAMQPILDSLLRFAPHKTRTEREMQQADEVYKSGHSIRFPPPREVSPAPDTDRSADYVHPCPHCVANNPYDWRCPQPIVDPLGDPDNAWHVDDGIPPGHGHCGNCENLLALLAPSTTKCDFCQVSFCGIGVQDRCIAMPVASQHPHNLSTHADLIQSCDIYDCFGGNTVEVEILLEYVENRKLTPRLIYQDIVRHVQQQPGGFQPLVELDLFKDIHPVTPSSDVAPDSPRNRICRQCAAEILLWGLKDWWLRERQRGFLEEQIINRPNCPEGNLCERQKHDHGHAREYNHIFPGTGSGSDEGGSSGTEILAVVSGDESTLRVQPAPSSSAGSLSFLLNEDNVEVDSQLSMYNQPLPDSDTHNMTDIQSS